MVETKSHFNKRLRTLGRKHAAMGNGFTTHLRSDGLIVVKPKRAQARFPLKGIVLVLLGLIAFKAFLLSSIGPDAYNDRISGLTTGTIFEQGGAWMMQIDPATKAIADMIGPTLRG